MAILAQRLSTRVERGAKGGPRNKGREKAYTRAGLLRQRMTASRPVHVWDVSHAGLGAQDFEDLRALWYVVNFAPHDGFLFRDWSDYQANQTNSALTLISGSNYQLNRSYTIGASTFKRKITRPDSGVAIYSAGGTLLTATVDTTTGIAAVTGTPSYWVGTFNVPVTFLEDDWVTELETTPAGVLPLPGPIRLEEVLE